MISNIVPVATHLELQKDWTHSNQHAAIDMQQLTCSNQYAAIIMQRSTWSNHAVSCRDGALEQVHAVENMWGAA